MRIVTVTVPEDQFRMVAECGQLFVVAPCREVIPGDRVTLAHPTSGHYVQRLVTHAHTWGEAHQILGFADPRALGRAARDREKIAELNRALEESKRVAAAASAALKFQMRTSRLTVRIAEWLGSSLRTLAHALTLDQATLAALYGEATTAEQALAEAKPALEAWTAWRHTGAFPGSEDKPELGSMLTAIAFGRAAGWYGGWLAALWMSGHYEPGHRAIVPDGLADTLVELGLLCRVDGQLLITDAGRAHVTACDPDQDRGKPTAPDCAEKAK